MRARKRTLCAWILLLFWACPIVAQAAEVQAAKTQSVVSQETEAQSQEKITEELIGELELDELDRFIETQESETALDLSFSELFRKLLSGDLEYDSSAVWSWIVDHCFSVVRQNQIYLAQMLVLLIAFAMLQGISGVFSDAFLSDISFLAVYFLFLYNALRIFASMQQIVYHCMERIAEFTLLIQPVFCMAMFFSSGINSASLTYELTLLVLYLIQTILQKVLLPIVFVFLVTQFANFAWK